MKTEIGEKGIGLTWQDNFATTLECERCGGEARIAFTAMESHEKEYVCELHKNECDKDKFWPHDAIAVAVYFCGKCCHVLARYNQG